MKRSSHHPRLLALSIAALFSALAPTLALRADCLNGKLRSTTQAEKERYKALYEQLLYVCSGPKAKTWTTTPPASPSPPSSFCLDDEGRATLRVDAHREWIDVQAREAGTQAMQKKAAALQEELVALQKKTMANPTGKLPPRMQEIIARFDAMREEEKALTERTTVWVQTSLNDSLIFFHDGKRTKRKGAPIVLEKRDGDMLQVLFLHGPWKIDDEGDWVATLDPTRPSTEIQTVALKVRGTPEAVEALLASCKLSTLPGLLGR